MSAKVFLLDTARRLRQCRRADYTLPDATRDPSARLDAALAAVAALGKASFARKLKAFRRVFEQGQR